MKPTTEKAESSYRIGIGPLVRRNATLGDRAKCWWHGHVRRVGYEWCSRCGVELAPPPTHGEGET